MLKPDNIVNPINFIKQCDAVYSKISSPNELGLNLVKYIEIENINAHENKSIFYINQEIELEIIIGSMLIRKLLSFYLMT